MWKTPLAIIALMLVSLTGFASEAEQEQEQAPLINVDMTLDLDGMEKYAQDASESLEVISQSLQAIVNNPNLSEDQQQALNQTVESINKLASSTKTSLNQLPQALDQSRLAFKQTSQMLLDDIQTKIIIALAAVIAVIIIALTAIYLLILKPMQQTLVKATNNISSMAQSIQITAEALKYSTEKQQKIMDYIEHSPTQYTDK
ncbi:MULTISPECIES: GTP-binding protein [unclassified Vibrio]|uniref:GTP-binding protein n=1 Tax=unclassified Vibrio TaxID=2614977 RepID=UPI000C81F1D3|nr:MULTISPECIES: GTP-binding protein [unclassified Vibrio]PMI22852.1 GTP-binding protein [Vibrio sp. 10N.286.46.E10]PMJ03509.1 GTP-binding protein [Vibrio sp. 10N.286.45.E10]PTP07054.1 GTP-binding protein [Vibrio sp. 10N.286.45.A3]PTQ24420.1 GTP-binding protein [Vibrio sp. 10N.286.46.E10]TKE88535.1 GTP-binding protein [Vibrio sp. F12]